MEVREEGKRRSAKVEDGTAEREGTLADFYDFAVFAGEERTCT